MLNKYIHPLLCTCKAIKLCCCGFVTDATQEKINGFAGRTDTTQLDDTCHCDMQRTAACGFLFYFRPKWTHGAKKKRYASFHGNAYTEKSEWLGSERWIPMVTVMHRERHRSFFHDFRQKVTRKVTRPCAYKTTNSVNKSIAPKIRELALPVERQIMNSTRAVTV